MKQELLTSQAVDILLADEQAGWSYYGAKAIVEYFEEIEDENENSINLDVVAIRCEYSEYDTCLEYAKNFTEFNNMTQTVVDSNEKDTVQGESEDDAKSFLEERTRVIPATDHSGNVKSYVILQF